MSVPNTEVKQSKTAVLLPANNGITCSNPVLVMRMCLCSSHLCFHVCSGLVTGQYPVKMSYQMSKTKNPEPEKRRDLALLSHVPEKRR